MSSCGECSASSAEMAGSLRSESTWAFTCRHLPTDWHDLKRLVRQLERLERLVVLKQAMHPIRSGRSIFRSQPVAVNCRRHHQKSSGERSSSCSTAERLLQTFAVRQICSCANRRADSWIVSGTAQAVFASPHSDSLSLAPTRQFQLGL